MKNIVLIGYMGCGKSTIGKAVAKELNYQFIDMDNVIQERCGMSIEQIFDRYGEEHFRDVESQTAEDLGKNQCSVIATGGGVVLRKQNIDSLRKNGYIFFLDTPIETIENRMSLLAGRPLLINKSPIQVRKHFEKRLPYYQNHDFRIHTEEKKIADIAHEIVIVYEQQENQK